MLKRLLISALIAVGAWVILEVLCRTAHEQGRQAMLDEMKLAESEARKALRRSFTFNNVTGPSATPKAAFDRAFNRRTQ